MISEYRTPCTRAAAAVTVLGRTSALQRGNHRGLARTRLSSQSASSRLRVAARTGAPVRTVITPMSTVMLSEAARYCGIGSTMECLPSDRRSPLAPHDSVHSAVEDR